MPLQPGEAASLLAHETGGVDALFVRIADGDRRALGPAFRLLWPTVHRFCARLLRSETDADDAAAAALEKAFERVMSWDRERSSLRWVLEIATWECRTSRRRQQRARARQSPADEALRDPHPSPERIAELRELEASLRATLAELSPADQEVIRSMLDGREVANAPAGATWRKRRQRALERLRALWDTAGAPGPELAYPRVR